MIFTYRLEPAILEECETCHISFKGFIRILNMFWEPPEFSARIKVFIVYFFLISFDGVDKIFLLFFPGFPHRMMEGIIFKFHVIGLRVLSRFWVCCPNRIAPVLLIYKVD